MPYRDDGIGHQRTDTSARAAEEIAPSVPTVRAQVEAALLAHRDGMTGDELAAHLGIDKLTVRPRITELRLDGRVVDTGRRQTNAIRKRVIVWAHRQNWRSIGDLAAEDAARIRAIREGRA